MMKAGNDKIALNLLVNWLRNKLFFKPILQKYFLINDIEKDLIVSANEEILAKAIGDILEAIVTHSQNNCIRISAKSFGNIILLYVKDIDSKQNNAIANSLFLTESMAGQLGGCFTLSSNRNKETTFAFSFYNNQLAA